MNVIYQITYPNGKIYIGQDRTDSINYHQSQTLDDRWRSLPGRKGGRFGLMDAIQSLLCKRHQ